MSQRPERPVVYDSESAAEADIEQTLAALGVTREQLLAEIEYRFQKKQEKMLKRMAAAQRAGGERHMLRQGGELASVEMMIDPVSYHYWGQRLGYQCWEDAQFRKEYLRDNDVSRIKLISKCGHETVTMRQNRSPAELARRRGVTGKRGRWAA